MTLQAAGERLHMRPAYSIFPSLRLNKNGIKPKPIFLDNAVNSIVAEPADGLSGSSRRLDGDPRRAGLRLGFDYDLHVMPQLEQKAHQPFH